MHTEDIYFFALENFIGWGWQLTGIESTSSDSTTEDPASFTVWRNDRVDLDHSGRMCRSIVMLSRHSRPPFSVPNLPHIADSWLLVFANMSLLLSLKQVPLSLFWYPAHLPSLPLTSRSHPLPITNYLDAPFYILRGFVRSNERLIYVVSTGCRQGSHTNVMCADKRIKVVFKIPVE